MTQFEHLEQTAYEQGVLVTQRILDETVSDHGVFLRVHGHPVILINRHRTTAEKTIALMEELAHYELTAGNILDQSRVENRKAEQYARAKLYQDLLPAIQNAVRLGLAFQWEVAEETDIPHATLAEIIDYCHRKGISLSIGGGLE